MASYPLSVCQRLMGHFTLVAGLPVDLSGQLLPFTISTATIVASLVIVGTRCAATILVVVLQPELAPKLVLPFLHCLIGRPV